MLSQREQKIVKFLLNYKVPVTAYEISKKLDINLSTLRKDLKQINEVVLSHGCELVSKPNCGYSLRLEDLDKIKNLISVSSTRIQGKIPDTDIERVEYIIYTLLTSKGYIILESLAKDLFVSRVTISKNLKDATDTFTKFKLKIVHKGRLGIKLEGEEKDKRFCLSDVFFNRIIVDQLDSSTDLNFLKIKETSETIKNIIVELLIEEKINLYGIAFENLITHIAIAVFRIMEKNYVSFGLELNLGEKYINEYKIAILLAEKLNSQFSIVMPDQEIEYITMHLISKRSIDSMQLTSVDSVESKTGAILNLMLTNIKEKLGLDFFHDKDLQLALGMHIMPLINRLSLNMRLRNPLVEEIKRKYMLSFDIASIGCEILNNLYRTEICEDEVAYLAIHFECSIQSQLKKTKNIIVVCASGRATSQLVRQQIESKLAGLVNVIDVVDVFGLSKCDLGKIDFIISTITIESQQKPPVIPVSVFVSDEEIEEIKKIIGLEMNKDIANLIIKRMFRKELFYKQVDVSDRKELMIFIKSKIKQSIPNISDEFFLSIEEREKIATTEYGNLVAIPHPIKHFGQETFIATFILQRPIKWQYKDVQLVFVFSLASYDDSLDHLYKALVKLINSNEKIKRIISMQNYTALIAELSF